MHIHANIESLSYESEFFQLNSVLNYTSTKRPSGLLKLICMHSNVCKAKVPTHRLELVDALSLFGFRLVEGEVELALNTAAEPTATHTVPLPGLHVWQCPKIFLSYG